jgi:hypothetical protein
MPASRLSLISSGWLLRGCADFGLIGIIRRIAQAGANPIATAH